MVRPLNPTDVSKYCQNPRQTMTFLNNKNICAKISLTCVSIIAAVLAIDTHFVLMPFSTVFLLLYVILVLCTTIWVSFVTVQHLLNQNKPFDVSLAFIEPYLTIERPIEPNKPNRSIDLRIDEFVADVDRLFIRKWYAVYISRDENFLTETKSLVDIVIRRFLQITDQIDSDKVIHGSLIILLKHVKEYRRTVRKVRNGGGSIETQYRYSHVGSKNRKAYEHFATQTTSKLLRHFVNWELYNSLACRCVVSVLSKKLLTYILTYISAPGYVNYKMVEKLSSDAKLESVGFNKYAFISISDVDHSISAERIVISEVTIDDNSIEFDAVDGATDDVKEVMDVLESTTPNKVEKSIERPVKIHESRSTDKTWRNSSDLDCISLGQDILYLADMSENDMQTYIEKKLWKNYSDSLETDEARMLSVVKEHAHDENVADAITEHHHTKTPTQQPSNITHFLRPATTGAATLITNTIIPIGSATMKEFQQSTVNNVVRPVSQATSNAMHKIGDLQDEAAGMVEGFLDFGMAGIRKGLRLTGLQDNIQETIPTTTPRAVPTRKDSKNNGKQKLIKLEHVHSDEALRLEEIRREMPEETVWVNPLVKNDSPCFEGDILLEKSPVTAESRSFSGESKSSDVIPILHVVDSPDPEYEDTTDLATTTAKLRSLLAQKTTESTINTPAASPMSLVPTPLDPSGSSLEDLSEVDGALPSMYKAWAKTATGVFHNTLNTIKTALPGNANDQEGTQMQLTSPRVGGGGMEAGEKQWLFVQSDPQPDDLSQHMEKFLAERRVFCTVDNAYEAIESIELSDQLEQSLMITQRQFDDEPDDFDTIPMTKVLVDLLCELVEDTYPSLVKDSIVKAILLTGGKMTEEKLHLAGEKFVKSINGYIGKLPKFETHPLTLPMKMDVMVELCMDFMPGFLRNVLNAESIQSILRLLLESLQSPKLNRDTNLQLLELFTSEIMAAANQTSPTYSA